MAKKGLLVLVFAALVAGGVFAESRSLFSVGGGVLLELEAGGVSADVNVPLAGNVGNLTVINDHVGFGGWFFADARFVELSVGFFGGARDVHASWNLPVGQGSGRLYEDSFFAFNLSLLGKFPIDLGRRGNVSIFPLLGIGLNVLGGSELDDDSGFPNELERWEANDLTVRIKFGVGGDFNLGQRLFLRTNLLGFYRLPTSQERDLASSLNNIPGFDASAPGGFGGSLRVGIGFRI